MKNREEEAISYAYRLQRELEEVLLANATMEEEMAAMQAAAEKLERISLLNTDRMETEISRLTRQIARFGKDV